MSSVSGVSGYNLYSVQQYLQSLYSQIGGTGAGTTGASDGASSGADGASSLSGQEWGQVSSGPQLSDQMQAQMFSYQAQGWPGADTGPAGFSTTDSADALAQNLFSQIDTSGSGSITKSELEQAVTSAGGTTTAADALYAKLDPNNTGSVTEQQFADQLSQMMPPPPPFAGNLTAVANGDSDQGTIGTIQGACGGAGGTSPSQLAQGLFSAVDTSGSGSITKSELEQAVTSAGGIATAADALYAELDPNNTGSVTEQQFADQLSQMMPPPPFAGNFSADGNGDSDQGTIGSIQGTAGGAGGTSPSRLAQSLFSAIDTSGSGSITKSELEQAVTSAGGTTTTADALYAQLDPTNSGSVTEQQFAALLQPPSPSGDTAQDALLALLNSATASSSTSASASSTSTSTASSTTGSSTAGDAAQEALAELQSFDAASVTSELRQFRAGRAVRFVTRQRCLVERFQRHVDDELQCPIRACDFSLSGAARAAARRRICDRWRRRLAGRLFVVFRGIAKRS